MAVANALTQELLEGFREMSANVCVLRGDRRGNKPSLNNRMLLGIVVAASINYLDEELVGAIWVGGEFVLDLN